MKMPLRCRRNANNDDNGYTMDLLERRIRRRWTSRCVSVFLAAMAAVVIIMTIMDSAAELSAAASDQQPQRKFNQHQYNPQPVAYDYSVLIISYHKTGVSSIVYDIFFICMSLF